MMPLGQQVPKPAPAPTAVDGINSIELTVELSRGARRLQLNSLLRALPVVRITVDDPVYGKAKTYDGFRLRDVMQTAGLTAADGDTLVFHCADGYEARLPLGDLDVATPTGVLAFHDVEAASGWEPFAQGKETVTPAPFYLVWTGGGLKRPWPDKLVAISVENMAAALRDITPGAAAIDAAPRRGFRLFEQNCLGCHSANLRGGTLGPELNVPRNVTEYREEAFLREFIASPSSFRARSKMPDFKGQLSAAQMDDLLEYLKWLRGHKIEAAP